MDDSYKEHMYKRTEAAQKVAAAAERAARETARARIEQNIALDSMAQDARLQQLRNTILAALPSLNTSEKSLYIMEQIATRFSWPINISLEMLNVHLGFTPFLHNFMTRNNFSALGEILAAKNCYEIAVEAFRRKQNAWLFKNRDDQNDVIRGFEAWIGSIAIVGLALFGILHTAKIVSFGPDDRTVPLVALLVSALAIWLFIRMMIRKIHSEQALQAILTKHTDISDRYLAFMRDLVNGFMQEEKCVHFCSTDAMTVAGELFDSFLWDRIVTEQSFLPISARPSSDEWKAFLITPKTLTDLKELQRTLPDLLGKHVDTDLRKGSDREPLWKFLDSTTNIDNYVTKMHNQCTLVVTRASTTTFSFECKSQNSSTSPLTSFPSEAPVAIPKVHAPPVIQYHLYTQNQKWGPYPLEQLKELIDSGKINGDSSLWREGLANWQPASTLPELTALFTASKSPPV